jgi:hypothetical protein
MDDFNRNEFTPNEEWHPDTLSDGRLGPPGRKPPTAVATATPRPPRRPYRSGRYRRLTTIEGITRGLLSMLLVGSGSVVVSLSATIAGIAVGAGLGGLGAIVAVRLVRQIRDRRTIVFARSESRSGDGPSNSVARSA